MTAINNTHVVDVPPFGPWLDDIDVKPQVDAVADSGSIDGIDVGGSRRNPLATVVDDLRGSWVAVAEPPTVMDWLAGPTTSLSRVPDGNPVLRFAWSFDNWFTGLLFLALSVVGFGVGAIARWLACHPARRWSALLLTVAVTTYLLVA